MILAMFEHEADLAHALERLRAAHIGPLQTYTPAPMQDAPENSPIPLVILLAGIAGAAASFALQAYSNTLAYPFKVGGRPQIAWPSFVPTVFENAVLIAVIAGFAAFLIVNRLPLLHHPVDESTAMRRASRDRWFVHICTRDPDERAAARTVLHELAPLSIEEIAA